VAFIVSCSVPERKLSDTGRLQNLLQAVALYRVGLNVKVIYEYFCSACGWDLVSKYGFN